MFTVIGSKQARLTTITFAPSTHMQWTSGISKLGNNIQVPGIMTILDYDYCLINGARYRVVLITPGTVNTIITLDRDVVEENITIVDIGYSKRDGRNSANWRVNDNTIGPISDAQVFSFGKTFKVGRKYTIHLLNEIDISSGVLAPQSWDFYCLNEVFVETTLSSVTSKKGMITYTFSAPIKECVVSGVEVDVMRIEDNVINIYTPTAGSVNVTLQHIFDVNGNYVQPITKRLKIVPDQEMVSIGNISYIIKHRRKVILDDYMTTKIQNWTTEEMT